MASSVVYTDSIVDRTGGSLIVEYSPGHGEDA